MSKYRGVVRLVLPTDEVVREFEPSELLLQKVDLTFQVLADYVIDQWAQSERNWHHSNGVAEMSAYELLLMYVQMDFLTGSEYSNLDGSDRSALGQLILAFCRAIYGSIVPILENYHLTDQQMSGLYSDRWCGKSMVLVVPRP